MEKTFFPDNPLGKFSWAGYQIRQVALGHTESIACPYCLSTVVAGVERLCCDRMGAATETVLRHLETESPRGFPVRLRIGMSTSALTTLAAAIFAMSAASGQVPMTPALAPQRPPIARKQPLTAPASTKRASVPAASASGPSQEDLIQLDQALRSLTPKERKLFTKAWKQMTPEGRKQLVEGMKSQRSAKGTSPQAVATPRVLKAPPPLPRRLVF